MSKKGRPPVRRSPADKKQLSYARDCRADYGNNNKAARKAVPRNKLTEVRKLRRLGDRATAASVESDEVRADLMESSIVRNAQRPGGWTKGADLPLGKWVNQQKGKAQARIGDKARRRIKQAYYATLLGLKR